MFLRTLALRRVACLAILAMLAHAFAPFAHAMAGGAARNGALFDPYGSICTSAGLAQSLTSSAPADDSAPTVDLSRYCPLCLAGAHVALAADVTPAFRADSLLQHVRVAFIPYVAELPATTPPFSPRAPPHA